ncbi:hypothetical protein F5888DRAFT_1892678 [Russula emetica]|nr:hypothetical protein F5888DRAFT_1892678 [Russula emetica]
MRAWRVAGWGSERECQSAERRLGSSPLPVPSTQLHSHKASISADPRSKQSLHGHLRGVSADVTVDHLLPATRNNDFITHAPHPSNVLFFIFEALILCSIHQLMVYVKGLQLAHAKTPCSFQRYWVLDTVEEVRSNAVHVLNDGRAAWEKRLHSDDEDAKGSTNKGYQGYSYHGSDDNDDKGGDDEAVNDDNGGDDEAVNEEVMWGSDTTMEESDARGPDPNYNQIQDDDGGGDNAVKNNGGDNAVKNNGGDNAVKNNGGDNAVNNNGGAQSDPDDDDYRGNGGYDGDDDDDHTYDDDGYDSTGPTDSALLDSLRLRIRPRNSGPGAVVQWLGIVRPPPAQSRPYTISLSTAKTERDGFLTSSISRWDERSSESC